MIRVRLLHAIAPLLPLLREAAAALYPALCAICRAPDLGDGVGCAEHRLQLQLAGPRCGRCALRLAALLPDGTPCVNCRSESPRFRRAACLLDYGRDPAARAWVLALKHGGRRDLAAPLGVLLGARLELEPASELPRVLVPVPLHATRSLERGYDQARLLADAVAGATGLAVVCALARVRATPPQGSGLAPPRAANVRGAFAPARQMFLGRERVLRKIRGAEVWLVDDVLTSGATANECARVLKRLGAARVHVLALARA
ncbi:MAG: ComF family protein [Planctomycetes bacterium]|nr:ComF family protein [Planctomycetota bacterium]